MRRPTRAGRTPAVRCRRSAGTAKRVDELADRRRRTAGSRSSTALRSVEHDGLDPVVAAGRGRRLAEPQLGVGLVRGQHEAALAREAARVARARGGGVAPVGLFGVLSQTSAVRPRRRRERPRGRAGSRCARGAELHPGAREGGAAAGDGVSGSVTTTVSRPPGTSRTTCANEKMASFEPSVGITWRRGRARRRSGGRPSARPPRGARGAPRRPGSPSARGRRPGAPG